MLQELPTLTVEQRQAIIRRALELDDSPLSKEDEALVESRLTALREDPNSGLSLEEMKTRIRARYGK